MAYSETALKVYKKLYFRPGDEDDPHKVHARVAKFAACGDVELEERLTRWMDEGYMRPNTPSLMNAGYLSEPQTAACYIGDLCDDLKSILNFDMEAALIYNKGSGIGGNYGNLREIGAPLSRSGESSGPFAFLRKLAMTGWAIKSGGSSRRAAHLGMMYDHHPNIVEWIEWKSKNKDRIVVDGEEVPLFDGVNLSVAASDAFMLAAGSNKDWELKGVVDGKIKKTVKADYLLDLMAKNACECGDPGIWFIDRANKDNTIPLSGRYESTNPCLIGSTLLFDGDRLSRVSAPKNIFKSWSTGLKKVVRVSLSDGASIICTPDHLLQTYDGDWVEAGASLKKKIVRCNGGLRFYTGPVEINQNAVLFGFLFGDGYFSGRGKGLSVKLDETKEPRVADMLKSFGFHMQDSGAFYTSLSEICPSILCQSESEMIRQICQDKSLPEWLMTSEASYVASFLRGLFAANGCVIGSHRVALKTTSRNLVEQIQILLSLFGIKAYFTTNRPSEIKWSNGDYISKESFDLNIADVTSLIRFSTYIGFLEKLKSDRLSAIISIRKSSNCKMPTVVSVEDAGEKEVFDFSMMDGIPFNNANGIIVHNCGEISGLARQACSLASINLAKCVTKPHYSEHPVFDWSEFDEVVFDTTTMLDNMLDISGYPTEKYKEMAVKSRPIGVGIMGLADALILLGIPYDSMEAYEFAAKVAKRLTANVIAQSAVLAEQKGPFDYFGENEGAVLKVASNFWNENTAQFVKTRGHGLRNSQWTTIAPTGSISISADCSQGMEPLFAICYGKRISDSDEVWQFVNPVFERLYSKEPWYAKALNEIAENHGSCQGCPSVPKGVQYVFRVAHDIRWRDRIKMQAALQTGISNSISSTINLPAGTSPEEVKQIYIEAWRAGLKGITVYVDGCKSNQPVVFGGEKKEEVKPVEKERLKPLDIAPLKRGEIVERPKVLDGSTFCYRTGCGKTYISVNHLAGEIMEAFANPSAGGGCQALIRGLSTIVSMAIRGGLDPALISNKLNKIICPSCRGKEVDVKSCPAAIAKAIQEFSKEHDDWEDDDPVEDFMEGIEEPIQEEQYEAAHNMDGYEIDPSLLAVHDACSDGIHCVPAKNPCPDCGAELMPAEGCFTCRVCGFSRCS